MLISLFALGLLASPSAPHSAAPEEAKAHAIYADCGLKGVMSEDAFRKAYASISDHQENAGMLAIADMTKPSSEKRLFVIDLQQKKLVLHTWVAHGRNSGELYCTRTSNVEGSLKTSKGLYRVGEKIISPKHGDALMLHGLDKGVNDNAEAREIILHGADYVSAAFIKEHGRSGRSFGCPAVPVDLVDDMITLLANGGLLYVYAR